MRKYDRGRIESIDKQIILFGAGKRGIEALHRYGKDKVAFFCDNSKEKQGCMIEGVPVISFDQMINNDLDDYIVMVTLGSPCFVIGQLENAGINDYILYQDYNPRVVEYTNNENDSEKKHNDVLRAFINESSKDDLLESIKSFKRCTRNAIEFSRKNGFILNYYTRGDEEEGYRYGNLQTILRYADREIKDGMYAPVVSHVISLPIYTPIFEHKTAVIFSGEYYKELIHRRAPWVPVFTIGPYIHYAKEIYSQDELRKQKEKIGSMLLVFLPHTLEDTERGFDRKSFIDQVKEKYDLKFDQIWLCVYFADINDEVCEYAEKIGIHIVSAGFRFDPMFNDRLKTIIKLSDAVVCGDIGGFLTYSIYMNKPIARIDISDKTSGLDVQYDNETEISIQKTRDYRKFENDFYRLFNEELSIDERHKDWMNPLAGYDLIRDASYINYIFDIANDIWECCKGNYRLYPDAVREVFYKYNDCDDINRIIILRQAVGTFLD